MGLAGNVHCAECASILREMRVAHRSDTDRLRDEWLASGRGLEELRDEWLASLANDDSADVIGSYYPKTAELRRRRLMHESLTGHSVFRNEWRGLFRQNL